MRLALQDHLQTHPFWLMDIALVHSGATPILSPLYGFSTITAPELTAEVQEITEGNWFFKRKVLKRTADVGNITLTRGVTFNDSDFYSWIINAIAGKSLIASSRLGNTSYQSPRRNLLLLHFFSHNPVGSLLGLLPGADLIGSALNALQNSPFAPELGPADTISNASRLIPARAFVLHGCIPMRYKTGSDFDASSAQVSVQELELAVEQMEQIILSV